METNEKFKSTVERMNHFDKGTVDESNGLAGEKKQNLHGSSEEVIVGTELIKLKRK